VIDAGDPEGALDTPAILDDLPAIPATICARCLNEATWGCRGS
jgi:hypothetical protein